MKRERLTITLRDDVLRLVDNAIDGETIRNRSHAIEVLLSQCLLPKRTRVLILAGGKPVFTQDDRHAMPKAMVKIAGRPLLEQTLQRLKAANLTDIYISLGEGGKSIQDYFGDGSHLGVSLQYVEQHNSSGTAQPLLEVRANFSGTFLLLYGDVLSDIDFGDLLEFHSKQKSALCTMVLSSVESVSMWGLAKLQGNRIVDFEEKPKTPKTHSRLINAGIYVMEPKIFDCLTPKDAKLESTVFPRLAEEGKLYGYPYEGLWVDISSSVGKKKN